MVEKIVRVDDNGRTPTRKPGAMVTHLAGFVYRWSSKAFWCWFVGLAATSVCVCALSAACALAGASSR
eukprot:11148190-Prorocentrum_lima.AAC.1